MNLKSLSDAEILSALSAKIQAEKRLITEIIEYVKEVDRRRLFLKLGYSSLFDYMTKELGYTSGSAQRRIDAARFLDEVPEIRNTLKSGEHNLMQISTLARAVREKEKIGPVSTEEKQKILLAIKSQDLQKSEKTVSLMLDIPIKTKEIKHVQQDDSIRMEITLSKEQADLFREATMQMSHVNPNPTFAEVFEYLAKRFLKNKTEIKDKKAVLPATAKMAVKSKTSKTPILTDNGNPPLTAKVAANPRYIPIRIRKQIFQEQGCCQWKNGEKICGSRFQLQIDHIKPIWAGGTSEKENLQALCSVHNRLRYLQQTSRAD